jgi:hypothetical protein
LHEHGKPLVAVWGFGGQEGRHLSNATYALQVVQYLKNEGFSVQGAMADNKWKYNYYKDSAWKMLVQSLDVLNPWLAPNSSDFEEVKSIVANEIEILNDANVICAPWIAPGFSWKNLKRGEKKLNDVPRNGGAYYHKRLSASIQGGARTLYTGMFDEVDEGTAIFKTLAKKDQLPTSGEFLSLDIDGFDLDSGFYLQMAGEFSSKLKAAVARG